jgi:hypothetical protein
MAKPVLDGRLAWDGTQNLREFYSDFSVGLREYVVAQLAYNTRDVHGNR